jgi:prepilin-type N-terminal cleavage/methylation domain-containing protein
MKRFNQNHRGFTLVELLAVVAVLGIVASILFGVLFTTLRGSSKSESLTLVSQNGNAALNQMIRMARFAKTLQSPDSCYVSAEQTSVATSSVTLINADGGTSKFECSDNTISSNSASLLDMTSVQTSSCQFICSQSTQYDAPQLEIQFTLQRKSATGIIDTSTELPFEATVTFRNIQ